MDRLRILLTNAWLAERGGTESVIRDLETGLLARGHRPIVYSPTLGTVAEEIRDRGIPVINDLGCLAEQPDVIHGQHLIPTAESVIRFPETPAFYFCHAWKFWVEAPPKFPQIRLYGAVSEAVRDRLVHTEGIAPERVMLLSNTVDLHRIPPRQATLPARPRRAIAFTNNPTHLSLLGEACRRLRIEFTALGRGANRMTERPEAELVGADLVFATGRSALEALACGTAVIVCDAQGMAGLVTTRNLDRMRRLNFALRALTRPMTVESVLEEIGRYDQADAEAVTARIHGEASLETQLDRLETIYRDIIAQQAAEPTDAAAHREALQRFLYITLPRRPTDPTWPRESACYSLEVWSIGLAPGGRERGTRLRTEFTALARSCMFRLGRSLRRSPVLPAP